MCAGCVVTTPKLTEQEISSRIEFDRLAMFKDQEPVDNSITLEESMARAIKYNLENRIKLMEESLSLRQLNLMTYDMLPKLVANAGYTERNSLNASSSMDVSTHKQSLVPSTSIDKGHFNADLTLTWNILDFGVSYFQARQQADRAHIMKERRRKIVHSIMQQVRQAYWLAYGAQQLGGRLDSLLKDVQKALADTASIEQEKLRPPMESLTYRKSLLEIMKQVETFRDEMSQAKPSLASLMNLPPGQTFTISPSPLSIPKGPDAITYLEIRALLQRPELIESDYNERISLDETRKAILRMLPGIELSAGPHYDSNSYLVNQQWLEGGARLTWNLMNLFSGTDQRNIAKSQHEIAKMQRLALSVAILTQVHVSYQNFYSRKRQYELSAQLLDIDSRIYEQTMNQAKSGAQNHLNEIRSATAAIMAEYRSYQNYAALQSACGQIISTLGDDPLPETVPSYEIKALSGAISQRINAPGSMCSPTVGINPAAISSNEPTAAVTATPVVVDNKPDAAVTATPVVAANKPEPIIALSMMPKAVTKGMSAKLLWVTKNVTKCEIQPGIGMVKPEGDVTVTPSETTAYTVTCSGDGGTRAETTTLEVTPQVLETASQQKTGSRLPQTMTLSLEYGTAEAEVTPEHYKEIGKIAAFLNECPEATGEIGGHTDDVRFADDKMGNIKLSQRRAENIRTYLINTFHIDPKRITAKGYGAMKPLADNRLDDGKQKNRRIEAIFKCKE